MKSKTKVWLGAGAFVVAGVSGAPAETPSLGRAAARETLSDIALAQALSWRTDFSAAKMHQHAAPARQGGEGGEAGSQQGELPPDLDFALKIAQMRGHLLVGPTTTEQITVSAKTERWIRTSNRVLARIDD